MKRAYCDRCGEEIKKKKPDPSTNDLLSFLATPLIDIVYDGRELDLCRGCKIELSRIIESWDKS